MKASQLKKITNKLVKEQMGGWPNIRKGGRLNIPSRNVAKKSPIKHTVPEVINWIDVNVREEEKKPWIGKRFVHALQFWNDCGGAEGNCPMPH